MEASEKIYFPSDTSSVKVQPLTIFSELEADFCCYPVAYFSGKCQPNQWQSFFRHINQSKDKSDIWHSDISQIHTKITTQKQNILALCVCASTLDMFLSSYVLSYVEV